jgi:hypothetical protein
VELRDWEPWGAQCQHGVAIEVACGEGCLHCRRHLLQGVPRRQPGVHHQGIFPLSAASILHPIHLIVRYAQAYSLWSRGSADAN